MIVLVNNSEDLNRKNYNIRLITLLIISIKLHLRNEKIDFNVDSILTKDQYLELTQVNNMPMRIIHCLAEYFAQIYNYEKVIS